MKIAAWSWQYAGLAAASFTTSPYPVTRAASGQATLTKQPSTAETMEPLELLNPRQIDPTVAQVDGCLALGCFEGGDILTATSTYNYDDMTPQLCANWCSAKSAPVFGLKHGYYCYCGEQIEPFAARADEDECTAPCSGAVSLACGGEARLNLYAPTDSDITLGTFTRDIVSSTTSSTTRADGNTSDDDGSDSEGSGVDLSVGALVGIVIAASAFSSIVAAVVVYFVLRRRWRLHNDEKHVSTPEHMPDAAPSDDHIERPANAIATTQAMEADSRAVSQKRVQGGQDPNLYEMPGGND